MALPPQLQLQYTIRREPKAVRAWWTELPDNYTATDPKEQPFRILTLEKRPDGALFETHWKTPVGVKKVREHLTLVSDAEWTYDVESTPFGYRALDRFRVEAIPGGTRLHVQTTFTPRNGVQKLFAPLLIPVLKKMFAANWNNAAKICERDAP